jgi:hypothetical protein
VSGTAKPACRDDLSVSDDVRPKLRHERPHFLFVDAWRLRPVSEPYAPVLGRGAGIPRRDEDVEVGNAVAEDEAVDVVGARHILKRPSEAVDQSPEGGGLLVGQVAKAVSMAFRLSNEVAAVLGRPGERVDVPGVDKFVLVEDSTVGGIAAAVLVADETPFGGLVCHSGQTAAFAGSVPAIGRVYASILIAPRS